MFEPGGVKNRRAKTKFEKLIIDEVLTKVRKNR
jgi:hypothetical protein